MSMLCTALCRVASRIVLLLLWLGLSGVTGRPAMAWQAPAEPSSLASPATTCSPGPNRLCLGSHRFKITASWKTPSGVVGEGKAVTLTDDTGYFWFFDSSNVEVVVKILDGCPVNSRFWVFAAGLTNVQVDLAVEDLVTGQVRTYHNTQNTNFSPIQDTAAFATCRAQGSVAVGETDIALPATALDEALRLNQDRFEISVNWQTSQGVAGAGRPVKLTDQAGYFWFFDPANVELLVKVLDGCAISGKYWVFSAGLTNVRTDITVKDLVTGAVKVYTNPQSTAFQPILDTAAFSCSGSDGLPPDPGEAGKQTLAGIDSDHDGVRDDLQRYIYFHYQGSSSTMTALRQAAVHLQQAVLDSASHNESLDDASALVRAAECLRAVNPANSAMIQADLLAETLNTEQRLMAYLQYNDQLAGATFPLKPVNQWATSCAGSTSLLGETLSVLPVSACAQVQGNTIFFGNGVWNTCADANQSAMRLASDAASVLSTEEYQRTSFQMACNPTQGHLADLWRATRQRFHSDSSAFLRALAGISLMPDFLKQELLDRADEITEAEAQNDPTLQQHADAYTREILEGRKVVVVAHSQGNFYANLSYFLLPSYYQPSFGIVSVANPDSYVAGGGPYTTLNGDLVIAAVIATVPGTLRSNTPGPSQPSNDLSGHMFLNSYMTAGSTSRNQILADLKDTLAALEPPDNSAGNGIITVTLNWGAEPDVDLHVTEPDGTHVYYNHRFGHFGFLDVDDVSSFGPEHYYVDCNVLAPGTYHVGVNYYQGDTPEVARVQIQAGLEVKSFQKTLLSERGSSGDSSPVPVADIVVTGDSVSGFHFSIVPR